LDIPVNSVAASQDAAIAVKPIIIFQIVLQLAPLIQYVFIVKELIVLPIAIARNGTNKKISKK